MERRTWEKIEKWWEVEKGYWQEIDGTRQEIKEKVKNGKNMKLFITEDLKQWKIINQS